MENLQIRKDYTRFIFLTGLLALLLGIAVISGWILNISFLKSVFPTYIPMKFNTAICFILLGTSIFMQANPARRARQISLFFSATFLAITSATLLEMLSGRMIGLDQFFIKDIDAIASGHPFPGRMSPVTAMCFFLLGFALLLVNSSKKILPVIAQYSFHTVTIIAFIAIVGYFFKVSELYKMAFITSMAIHTALALFFTSIAGSLINNKIGLIAMFSGGSVGNVMARKLFPGMAIAILLLGLLRLISHRYVWVDVELGISLYMVAFLLVSIILIWKTSLELNKIDLKREEAETILSQVTTILDSTPDPIVIVDEKGMIKLVNAQTKNVFKYEKEELIGKKIETLIPDRFRNQHESNRNGFVDKPKIRNMGSGLELFAIDKNGKEFPVEVSISPVKMKDKTWVSAAIRDVTLRKAEEMEINRLASIVKFSIDGIISTTLNGIITTWNGGAEKIFGYTPEDVLGKHISILLLPESMQEEEMLSRKLRNGEIIEQYEAIRVRKDKSKVNLSITISPIKDKKGTVVSVSKVVRDITNEKNAEEKLRAVSILEAKSKEMEQLTYIASHDLRHPVLTIINYSKILYEEYQSKLDAEGKQCVQSISNAASRMDKLIIGLLDYSRLSKLKQFEMVDCNKIIQAVLVDLDSIIKSTNARMIVSKLPTLNAYPLELRQLFQNLIINALTFIKPDVVPELHISATKHEDHYIFEFQDNGIGIEAKNLEKIFQIFQRLHTNEEYEGTGLGLAYCKKIVELHRGQIWVESEAGRGSTFCFTIKS